MTYEEVSWKHTISESLVGRVVRANKLNPEFVQEMQQKLISKSDKIDAVTEAIENYAKKGIKIWHSRQVSDWIDSEKGLKLTCNFISSVMRNRHGMRYKSVRRIPWQGNSERSLVQR